MSQIYRDLLSEDENRPGILYFGGARVALLDIESGFWTLRRQMEALVGRRLTDGVLQQAGVNGGASFARAFAPDVIADNALQALRDCVAAYQAAGFGRFEIEALEWPIGRVLIRGTDTFESWVLRRHGQQADAGACSYTAGVFVGFINALTGRGDIVCVKHACQAQGADSCLFELLPAEQAPSVPVVGPDPDPLLSQQLSLLDILFDRMPMGIAIIDRDLRLRRCNPTWAEFIDRYTPSTASQVVPGAGLFDLAPGTEKHLSPVLERVLAGETVRLEAFGSESGGIVSYRDVVFTPLIQNGDVVGFVEATMDTTERVVVRQDLEQRVADRTRELSALYDVMAAASASLDLGTVLKRSLGQVLKVMGSEVGAIHLLDETGEVLRLAASSGVSPAVESRIDSILVEKGLAGRTIEHEEPLIVPNLAESPRPLLAVPAAETQSYVGVPVRAKGQVLGVLSVVGETGREFGEQEVSLLASIANEVGVAVENARLYQQVGQLAVVRERERLARELHDSVTQSLYSITLLAEAGQRFAGAGNLQRVEEYLERLGGIAQQALKEMRLLVYELRPLVLKREGLVGALQQRVDAVEKRAGVEARLLVEGRLELPARVEEELFRVAQEALNNALKHAAPTSVTVRIRAEGGQMEMEIADDGRGYDLDTTGDRGGLGLISMQERVEKLGGSFAIHSVLGEGTTVRVRLEVPQ